MSDIKFNHLEDWFKLSDIDKKEVFTRVAFAKGLPSMAIEKDWWVVNSLAVIFSLHISPFLLFKGGTSLSKCWELIERFSEDIDLSIDRRFFGFAEDLERAEVRKLRKVSCRYLTHEFVELLQRKFDEVGFREVQVQAREFPNHDQDPVIIEIYYQKLVEEDEYTKPGIILEIGSRSLREPFSAMPVNSFVTEDGVSSGLLKEEIIIPAVNPERTFLEKIFLVHEALAVEYDPIKTNRMSRHLYDLVRISKTPFASIALGEPGLYSTIVEHRSKFTRISGIDYSQHQPSKIVLVPGEEVLKVWKSDYEKMREFMIFGESPTFSELIAELKLLQQRVNSLPDVELYL